MAKTWETFEGELPNGREVRVFYDHATSLTVVPDYVRGRTLIFHDGDLNNEDIDPNSIISCYVPNHVLEEHSPEEVFAMAKSLEKI